jgi:hypothetical protein
MDFSLLTRAVKKENRNEEEFKIFEVESYLFFFEIFTLLVIISSISNFKMF